MDDRGGAWFPEGRLRRWDFHDRPLFHGHDLELEVPAVPLTVTCARGMEFAAAEVALTPRAGATTEVELEPERLYETAARGWYGGDLHVHMNYSGDLVCGPDDAARMQLGEGLHLMSLVAGNLGQTRVYDRQAFEATVGDDLPWTTAERVARFAVEYRNDLLGHFHALGPTGRPARYHSGHEGSDEPFDWPANATACQEFRELGATVGYTHPVFSPLADGSPAGAFAHPRSVEARELVADAALGLVDSVDLIGPSDVEGTAVLYHHLLSCGLRLAATAGTDVWLSYSRGPLISNPPGWGRVYADLRGEPLS
ncbi:MAG TPA: CehA/McbA family metallohydrolase, partial [Actinomycetota bacterium]|nr:CehA/McbA family metallohydrolase [Actinomycetota bacterium]